MCSKRTVEDDVVTVLENVATKFAGSFADHMLQLKIGSALNSFLHQEPNEELDSWGGQALCQIPNIGKLASLQHLQNFDVQKKKGYELQQLKNLNELGGSLMIGNIENVTGKDEALESKLHQKSHLKSLQLVWSCENGVDEEDISNLEILKGLTPPPQLNSLTIKGYKSSLYPSWLQDGSYFENLEYFRLIDCRYLEGLPPDPDLLCHCSELYLNNVPKLKALSSLPAGLTSLFIRRCPLLLFITKNELQEHIPRENMMTDHLASKLALIWEADSKSKIISRTLSEEHSSLKQLATLMDVDISKQLQIIENYLEEERVDVLAIQNVIKAWLCCHEKRVTPMYGRVMGLQLVLPSGLRELELSSCGITDGALAISLGGLTSLRRLFLVRIMTLTALPSEEVFQQLTKLDFLFINSCWCLRSLGGLRAAMSLSSLTFGFCPSLELARAAELIPLSLVGYLSIYNCILAADTFINGLSHLKVLSISGCRSSASLPIGHLTSLESLQLCHFPDLCFLEGLSSLQLQNLQLVNVPKLTAQSISKFRVQKSLYVSSSIVLNHMLSSEGFVVPGDLTVGSCEDPSDLFQESSSFSSVKILEFQFCEMKSLPRNLNCLSSLERLVIFCCPNISSLPDLPSSLKHITIRDCELLKESCRAPDGESWPKIAHIRWKDFRELY